jgi:hypothetical protein
MKLGRCLFAFMMLLALSLPGRLAAQSQTIVGAMNPQVTIALAPVTGGGVRNLALGTIAVGGTADTGAGSEANTNSAKWEFGGLRKNETVTLTFSFPTMTNGSSTLPVVWSNAGYGSWCTRVAPNGTGTCGGAGTETGTFNPGVAGASAHTPTGAGNNDRILTVWIGATVSALPANMAPGLYTGTISLTMTIL